MELAGEVVAFTAHGSVLAGQIPRVIRWNFQRGGANPCHFTFGSDPRIIRDITA